MGRESLFTEIVAAFPPQVITKNEKFKCPLTFGLSI